MRSSDLPQVRTLPLFRSMAGANFDRLVAAARVETVPAQCELFHEGEPADFLHVVLEGCVELYARWNERETVMEMVRPPGAFVLAAVIRDALYLKSCRTHQRSTLLLIQAPDVRAAFRDDDAFARAVACDLAGSYREMVKQQKDLKLRTAVERLANSLLTLDCEQGGKGCIGLPYDKRMLASLLGMTPENLSRAFNTLRPYGVEVDGARITLTDMKSLERLAKPSPLIDDATV